MRPYIAWCDHEIVCPSWPITVSHCTTFFIYHPKSCSLQRLVNLAHIRGLKPTIVHKCQEKHLFITWLNFLLGQRPGSMDILACDAQRGIDYICQLLKGVELKRLFNMVTIKMIQMPGFQIRPIFDKVSFWYCRTLEFFPWVFNQNLNFLGYLFIF